MDTSTPATPAATETNAQPQGQGTPAQQTDGTGNAVKDAAAEAIRKHKLKVDGQEIEVDEEELKRGYAHQKAANKKLQAGLRAQREADNFIKLLKTDPIKALSDPRVGHDVRKLAEEYLASQLEDEMLDPKEKELREYRKKLETYEQKEKREKEEAEKRANDALKAKYAKEYSDQFVDALKKTGLPASKPMVAEMAKYIARAAKINMPMTADEAAKLVKEDMENHYRSLYGEADPETLVKLIGEQGLQKVRGYDTSRLKDPAANLKTPETQGERQKRAQDSKRMTPQEWRAYNRK